MSKQVNVPLDDYHALVLAQVVIRDERSIPEILRPVIETFLDAQVAEDSDLRNAVAAMARSRRRRRSRERVSNLTPRLRQDTEP